MDPCAFSPSHYTAMLRKAASAGYTVQSLWGYLQAPRQRALILRHDVDVSLDFAVRVGEIEVANEARSSFFVRVHGRYNPFSRENYERLQWLDQRGFDVGLHHEIGSFALNGASPTEQLARSWRPYRLPLAVRLRG